MLIDSHCHLNDPRFNDQQAALIAAAAQAEVSDYVVPATTVSGWPAIHQLATDYPGVHPAYGLHPWFIDQHDRDAMTQLSHWLASHPAVAVGECGLDFLRPNRPQQEQLFAAQIELARDCNLPLIIHAHKALDRVIQMLRQFPGVTGVIHRFSGSLDQAQRLIDLDFYVGVAAGITDTRQAKLRRTLAALPLERLLLESDAPDLPPAGVTAELNAPEFLPLTLTALAELQQQPPAQVARQTSLNSQHLFNIQASH